LRLALFDHPGGVDAAGPNTVVFDLEGGDAHLAPARVKGPALRWVLGTEDDGARLSAEVDLAEGWLVRCDRVDFAPGGVAHRHVHPGPGIRRLLFGSITIDSAGRTETYGPGGAWFERGPEPVLATTTDAEPTAFVRVMLVPPRLAGQRTIRYVDPADAEKPKTQRATVFLEEPVRP
jgi:quercetin dioxygenase-like cupin family protein